MTMPQPLPVLSMSPWVQRRPLHSAAGRIFFILCEVGAEALFLFRCEVAKWMFRTGWTDVSVASADGPHEAFRAFLAAQNDILFLLAVRF